MMALLQCDAREMRSDWEVGSHGEVGSGLREVGSGLREVGSLGLR